MAVKAFATMRNFGLAFPKRKIK